MLTMVVHDYLVCFDAFHYVSFPLRLAKVLLILESRSASAEKVSEFQILDSFEDQQIIHLDILTKS